MSTHVIYLKHHNERIIVYCRITSYIYIQLQDEANIDLFTPWFVKYSHSYYRIYYRCGTTDHVDITWNIQRTLLIRDDILALLLSPVCVGWWGGLVEVCPCSMSGVCGGRGQLNGVCLADHQCMRGDVKVSAVSGVSIARRSSMSRQVTRAKDWPQSTVTPKYTTNNTFRVEEPFLIYCREWEVGGVEGGGWQK